MRQMLKRLAAVIAILAILGLVGRMIPDPPKHRPSPETREEGIQRISAEYGYSQDEVRRAMDQFERNR